jgi:hypothetical protein
VALGLLDDDGFNFDPEEHSLLTQMAKAMVRFLDQEDEEEDDETPLEIRMMAEMMIRSSAAETSNRGRGCCKQR